MSTPSSRGSKRKAAKIPVLALLVAWRWERAKPPTSPGKPFGTGKPTEPSSVSFCALHLHRAPVGQGPSCPGWLATALGFWSGRPLATGTAWAGLCLLHHHRVSRSLVTLGLLVVSNNNNNNTTRPSGSYSSVSPLGAVVCVRNAPHSRQAFACLINRSTPHQLFGSSAVSAALTIRSSTVFSHTNRSATVYGLASGHRRRRYLGSARARRPRHIRR